jgi:hypothetical protein
VVKFRLKKATMAVRSAVRPQKVFDRLHSHAPLVTTAKKTSSQPVINPGYRCLNIRQRLVLPLPRPLPSGKMQDARKAFMQIARKQKSTFLKTPILAQSLH